MAVVAAAVLARAARRRSGAQRRARTLLAAGVGLAAVVPLVAAAVEAGWLTTPATGLAIGAAVASAVVAAILVAGLVGLAGVLSYAGALLRHSLDAAVVAGALCFVGWVGMAQLFKTPGRWETPAGVMLNCPSGTVSVVVLAAAVGMVSAGLRRTLPPRTGMLVGGLGVCLLLAGCGVIAVSLCWDRPGLAVAGGIGVAAGAVAVAAAGFAPEPPSAGAGAALRGGTSLALLPIVAVVITGLYQTITLGWFDVFGAVAAAVVGCGLVARHHLTLVDARRYADRLAEREAHFRQLAHTDPLTGLANRRGLLEVMHAEVVGGPPCVLLALDLDGFKDVNDMRGHDIGDAVLVEVGRRLSAHVRPGDVAARLGGDEFAVLMWTVPERAHAVAQRLLAVLSQPYQLPGATVFLSVSIGLAGCATADDVPSLLRNADLALRYAKQRGKGRAEEYDAAYDALLRRRTTLDHELRGAIERGELHLVFQPVVALPAIRPAGAEALLRWHHPELGTVAPAEFVPVAEESGMISVLGAWVLHQACHQLSRLLAEGHDVWVSVNVSPLELRSADYVRQVSEALAAHRVPPQRLVLEVTEHAVATDLDELVGRLAMLRATGVRIALDDFGAGYSSLGQLRRLPVDILKLDHGLVDDGETSTGRRRAAPLLEVVVRLGQRLGLEVIAEGISDPEHLSAVTNAGCRFGQGRLLGIAVPAEHLEAKLAAAGPAAAAVSMLGRRVDHGGSLAPATLRDQVPYQNVGRLDSGPEMRHG